MRLFELVQEYFRELLDFQPVWATALGKGPYAARTVDLSAARVADHVRRLKKFKLALAGVPVPGVWGEERIERELMRSDLEIRLKEWGEWRRYRKDPSLYVGELLYGLWYLFLRLPERDEKVEAALARLRGARQVVEAAQANLENPPRLWTDLAVDEARGYLRFLGEVRAELLRLAPRRRAEIHAACREATRAGEEFLQFLEGPLRRRSDGSYAVGRADFDFLLRHYHHYEMKASELKRLGERQFAEVKAQLLEQARRIDPKTPWQRQIEAVKRRHPRPGELLQAYRRETRRLRRFVSDRSLASLPRGESLQVIETPEFTRSTIPFAAYVDPPMYGGKNLGTFFVTPIPKGKRAAELLQEHNFSALRVTSLHEGYPGHHLQFAVQKRAPGTMMRIYNCSSFYEGWALYCEELMQEAGYYSPEDRLIQLKDKLWRACRIIVDVGLHTGAMSDQEAVRWMAKELKMSPVSARADVNWYTMRPTVPQGYFTGMLLLTDLRERCRKKWGRGFTLKKFHDAVLRRGAIPIPLLAKSLR